MDFVDGLFKKVYAKMANPESHANNAKHLLRWIIYALSKQAKTSPTFASTQKAWLWTRLVTRDPPLARFTLART